MLVLTTIMKPPEVKVNQFFCFHAVKGRGLKVAFYRKCDVFFRSPNLKKNIPKNYPELEI